MRSAQTIHLLCFGNRSKLIPVVVTLINFLLKLLNVNATLDSLFVRSLQLSSSRQNYHSLSVLDSRPSHDRIVDFFDCLPNSLACLLFISNLCPVEFHNNEGTTTAMPNKLTLFDNVKRSECVLPRHRIGVKSHGVNQHLIPSTNVNPFSRFGRNFFKHVVGAIDAAAWNTNVESKHWWAINQ